MLGHNASLNMFDRIEIILRMLFDHDKIRNHELRKISGKPKNIWIVNNTLQNNP